VSETFDPYRKWLGIPAADQPPNHYRLLGIELYENDPDVIEQAADRQMAHVQTHKTGPNSAASQKLLNELSAARLCLLKLNEKAAYDAELRAKLTAKQPVRKAVALSPPAAAVIPVAPSAPLVEFVGTPRAGPMHVTRMGQRRDKPVWQQPAMLTLAIAVVVGVVAAAVWLNSGDAHRPTRTAHPTRRQEEIPKPRDESAARPNAKPEQPRPTAEGAAIARKETSFPDSHLSDTKSSPAETVLDHSRALDSAAAPLAAAMFAAGEAVDLLNLIDVQRDSLAGEWRLVEGRLKCPATGQPRLQVPLSPPREYVLIVEATWHATIGVPERLNIALPVMGANVMLDLGGFGGDVNGLHTVDGKGSDANETTRRGRLLVADRSNTVVCTVRARSVQVALNGEVIIDWKGDPKRLGHEPRNLPPDPSRLYLQSYNSAFEITRLELAPLTAADAGGNSKARPRAAVAGATDHRLRVPSDDEQKRAGKKVRALFKDMRSSKSLESKMKLARFLGGKAEQNDESPAEQYVMYAEALELSVDLGDYSSAVGLIMKLADRFDVEGLTLRADALTRINRERRAPSEKFRIVDLALDLIAVAVAHDDYATAEQVAKLTKSAAKVAKDRTRAEHVAERARDVSQLAREFERLASSRARLVESPTDAEANLAVGLFECVWKRDWDRALPKLAVVADEPLRQAALADLSLPADSKARIALGEHWLALAEEGQGDTRVCHQLRAMYWFRLAQSRIAEHERAELAERIARLEQDAAIESRARQWLERQSVGFDHEAEIDCASAARRFPMAESFDPTRSWTLSLEFLPGVAEPHGQIFFWGDDRGGHDPLFVRCGDGRLDLGLGDARDGAKAHAFAAKLGSMAADRWLHLRVTYRQSDRSVFVELDDQRIAGGVCPFAPFADRPMLIWIGGASADSQRFGGKVRMVSLRN
jgi:hypothetical protein